jgi:hypothetical protein
MDRIRGIVMLIAAALAIWKGWQIQSPRALFCRPVTKNGHIIPAT